jgi:cytochrome b involved in lipid metabolism
MASKNNYTEHDDDDDDDDDDVRHMNDTTMPPPKRMIPKSMPASNGAATTTKTNNPRRKFGLRKGFGLQDWVVLTKTAKDLAQRKGASLRQISPSELRHHDQPYDGWCSLKGKVYNIAPYLAYHPGGEVIMKKILGKDATLLFDKYHRWVNIDGLIGALQLGYLDTTSNDTKEESKPAFYMTATKQQDECEYTYRIKCSSMEFGFMTQLLFLPPCCTVVAIPASVITKTKAKDMNNVLAEPPQRDEDKIDEEYTEPWEEPSPKV